MSLPKSLLSKKIHDAVLKQVAEVGYDIDRITDATESGGLALTSELELTITTGGTAQIVKAFSSTYKTKVIVASAANGTLVTTADLDFDLAVEGTIRRSGNTDGEVRLELVSDKDGVVASQVISRSANVVTKFAFSEDAVDLAAANTLTLKVSGDTVTGEVFRISDCAVFAESTT